MPFDEDVSGYTSAATAIRRLERDPSVLGASPRLLVAGRRPR